MLTVFTPTFQRAGTLERLYDSLASQESLNFVWHVVDDGSTDGTKDLIRRLETQAPFPILYTYTENGGKARAYNLAVAGADTPLFMCLDSDDSLAPGAIALIERVAGECQMSECAGILGYWASDARELGARTRFRAQTHTTLREEYQHGYAGDTALVFRTRVLKKCPFPEFKGEKFVTENFVYSQIEQIYRLHVVDAVLSLGEYRADGLSAQGLKLKRDNPLGWREYYALQSRLSDTRRNAYYFSAQSLCYHLLSRSRGGVRPETRYGVLAWPAGAVLSLKRRRQYAAGVDRHR